MLAWGGMARDVSGLGPGRRTVVWVAGCSLRCSGCMTPELLAQRTPDMPVQGVADLVLAGSQWDGRLTISGGEPFEQAAALAELVTLLRQARECEVLVYSGRRIEELRRSADAVGLLAEIDMLIDSPFVWSASNERPWRGSDNQRFHALTPIGAKHAAAEEGAMATRRPLSVQWVEGLGLRVIGIPHRTFFRSLYERIAARGLAAYGVGEIESPAGEPER